MTSFSELNRILGNINPGKFDVNVVDNKNIQVPNLPEGLNGKNKIGGFFPGQ
jgi:hypothetical protein